MIGTVRRKVIAGTASVIVAGSLVFIDAGSAQAVIVEPLIPAAAEAVGGAACAAVGVETLGVGCLVIGAGLLAVGAYAAWSGYQQVVSYTDPVAGTSSSSPGVSQPGTAPTGSSYNAGWDLPNWPAAGSGPIDMYCHTTINAAACGSSQTIWASSTTQALDQRPYVRWCTLPAGCGTDAGVVDSYAICQSKTTGALTYTAATAGSGGKAQNVNTYIWNFGMPCNNSNQVLVQASNPYIGLMWSASGGWDQNQTSTTTVTCKTPGGGTSTVTATNTGTADSNGKFAATIPACPSGTYGNQVVVKAGPTGSPGRVGYTWQAAPSIESTYPACFTAGGSGCQLVVQYAGQACSSDNTVCQGWYVNSQSYPAQYGCLWGPYSVPLSSCLPLKDAYVPGAAIDPGTGAVVAPAPTPTPTAGGGAQPTTGTNPSPSLSATAPNPFSTAGSTATVPPVPIPNSPTTTTGGNCMDAAWGWNPVQWVVIPVECALTWAFVPDQAVMQQTVSDMGNHWHASATGTFVDGAFGMFATLGNLTAGDAQACGLVVDFPYAQGHSQEIRLLDSCTPPMSTYAPWVKGFLTAMLLFDGIYACVRALGIGFGIGVPPKMGQLDLFSQN